MKPVYLDNNSTTRVDPRVLEAMLPFFTEQYGNAASQHHNFGHRAAEAADAAREMVAATLGANEREIYFTSGATESNNLAIKGWARSARAKGNHIVTSQIEHRAVLDVCRRLEREGFEVTYVPVSRSGIVDPGCVAESLSDRTILVSIMFVNNESGVIQPVREIGEICRKRGIVFHCDATQAFGKLPIHFASQCIDLLSLSAHKIYGPKGVGALYVRRRSPRVRLEPLFDGGGHERGLRSGTLPVPLVVGLGRACQIAVQDMDSDAARIGMLRDRLESTICSRLPEVSINGDPRCRVPGTSNLSFSMVEGEALMLDLRDVALSSGSACSSANAEPSYVLKALGLSDDAAHSSVRFSVGRFNTVEEIDYVASRVEKTVSELRQFATVFAARTDPA